MKVDYTKSELLQAVETLKNFYARVELLDPGAQKILAPDTLQPTADYPSDWRSTKPDGGCLDQRTLREKGSHSSMTIHGDHAVGVHYQYLRIEGRELVLGMANDVTETLAMDEGGLAALTRNLQELNRSAYHDYLSGAYNCHYLNSVYLGEVLAFEAAGREVSFALVQVDHFEDLCQKYGEAAKTNLMGYVVSLFQQQIDPAQNDGVVVRLDDNTLLVSCVGHEYSYFCGKLSEMYATCRKDCLVNIYKRLHFTLSIASAGWNEAKDWPGLKALLQQRLADAKATGGNAVC